MEKDVDISALNNEISYKDVDTMLKEWDIVKCHNCGKQISILKADIIEEKYFVCKERC